MGAAALPLLPLLLPLLLDWAGGMALREEPRGWDSWLVNVNGTFTVNYMAGPRGAQAGGSWNHVVGASSVDGVHWAPQGMLYDTPPDCCPAAAPACAAMGSGTTWAVISNASGPTTYATFFSSGLASDRSSEGLRAVTSTDLLSWTWRPQLTFHSDPNWYNNTAPGTRWDGPTVVCQVDESPCKAGYFMALTATSKATGENAAP